MIHALKKLLLALCCLAAVAAAALSLPWMTERAIAGTLDVSMPFAQRAQDAPQDTPEAIMPTQHVPLAATPAPEEQLPFLPVSTLQPVREHTLPPEITPVPAASPMPPDPAPDRPLPWEPLPTAAAHATPAPADDWRAFLQAADRQDDQAAQEKRLGLLAMLGVDPKETISGVYRWDGELLIAEALMPADLARQKLITGLLAALDNPGSFVQPDALHLVQDLPIWAAAIRQEDQAVAVLALTNRQRMAFAALAQIAQNPPDMAGNRPYSSMREGLLAQIAFAMPSPYDAYTQSTELVRQFGEKAGINLAVVQAEPYECTPEWEYYVAGHHVTAVDMATGHLYTLTTDLLSSKVIGLAEENAQAYLKTYAHLLERAQTQRNAVALGTNRGFDQKMTGILSQLSGVDFAADPAQWSMEFGGGIIDNNQSVWTRDIYPADYEARLLDAQGVPPVRYSLVLDDSLALYSYEAVDAQYASSGGESMWFDQPGFDDWLWKNAAYYASHGQNELVDTLQYAANEPEQLALQQLSSVNLENDGLFNFITLRALNVHWQDPAEPSGEKRYWVTLSAELTDQRGLRFVMEILVNPDHSTSLLSITRADAE